MARKGRTRTRRRRKPLNQLVAERLVALRNERSLTRKKLAELAKVSLTNLHFIERGDVQPTLKTLEVLARALGVGVRDLLDDEAPPPKAAEGTKTFHRLVNRLREHDEAYLRAVERLIKAFDAGLESAE